MYVYAYTYIYICTYTYVVCITWLTPANTLGILKPLLGYPICAIRVAIRWEIWDSTGGAWTDQKHHKAAVGNRHSTSKTEKKTLTNENN